MTVQLDFLEKAFKYILDNHFKYDNSDDIDLKSWQNFCEGEGVTLNNLKQKKEKLYEELAQIQSSNASDNECELKRRYIFCCDPFETETETETPNINALLKIWEKIEKEQTEPYSKYIRFLYHYRLVLQEHKQKQQKQQSPKQAGDVEVKPNRSTMLTCLKGLLKIIQWLKEKNPHIKKVIKVIPFAESWYDSVGAWPPLLNLNIEEKLQQKIDDLEKNLQQKINNSPAQTGKYQGNEPKSSNKFNKFLKKRWYLGCLFLIPLIILFLLPPLVLTAETVRDTLSIDKNVEPAENYFNLSDSNKGQESKLKYEIDALSLAMDEANKLNKLTSNINSVFIIKYLPFLKQWLISSLPYKPFEALHLILSQIHEKDRFPIDNQEGKSNKNSIQAMTLYANGDSPDDPLIAISRDINHIELWKSSALKSKKKPEAVQFNQLPNECNAISSLSFNSTGEILVVGNDKGKVCILKKNDGKETQGKVLQTNTQGKIYSMSFSPNNEFIAIAFGNEGNVIVVDSKTGTTIVKSWQPNSKDIETNLGKDREENSKTILGVSFNQDGTKIATAGKNGRIKLWKFSSSDYCEKLNFLSVDWFEGELPEIENQIDSSILSLKLLNPENEVSCEKIAKIWAIHEVSKINWLAYNNGIESDASLNISFKKDGNLLVLSENNEFKVLEYSEKLKDRPIKIIKLNGYGTGYNNSTVKGAGFIFKNDSKDDKFLLFTIVQGPINGNPTKTKTFLQIWDLSEKGEYPYRIPVKQGTNIISQLSLRDQVDNEVVSILALDENKNLNIFSKDGNKNPTNNHIENKQFSAMSFVPKDKKFITVDVNNNIQCWNFTPKPLDDCKLQREEKITSIAINSETKNVAIGTRDGSIYLLDASLKEQIATSENIHEEVKMLFFSKDGQYLVSVSDNATRTWSVPPKEGKIIPYDKECKIIPCDTLNGEKPLKIDLLSENSDSYIAFPVNNQKEIKLLNLSEKKKSKLFNPKLADDEQLDGISFSKTSTLFSNWALNQQPLIAVLTTKKKIKIWDWSKQKLIAQFESKLEKINSIVISTDAKEVFIGGGDGQEGKVERWPVKSLNTLIDNGCVWLQDYYDNGSRKKPHYCDDPSKTAE